jgi:hypothetical protein
MQLSDRGLTEVSSGLTEAQRVLRRRRQNLQERTAAAEAEIAELNKIEAAVGMALEILRGAAGAREQAAKDQPT